MLVVSRACSRGFSLMNKYEIKGAEIFSYKPGSLQREADSGKGGLGDETSDI